MKYVVGIDGGGTKTKLTVCNKEGQIVYTVVSGPSNILSSGYNIAKNSITEVIDKGMIQSGYGLDKCEALCIGVAGAARENIKRQLEEIIREIGYQNKVIITHDAETALVGGTDGGEGILVIAGTGAICYGKNKEGMIHRVSGWGHIIGDEGSAYSMGIKVMNAVMKAYDGRGEETVLTKILLERMQVTSPEEIIGQIYKPDITKQHIAEYAILVDTACKVNDEVAFEIIEQTVQDLFECTSAALKRLEFTNKPVKIIINGSVLVNNAYVNKGFKEKLAKVYPLAEISTMIHDAAYGAALIALQVVDR